MNTITYHYLTSFVPGCTMYERQRGRDEVLSVSTDKQTIRGPSDCTDDTFHCTILRKINNNNNDRMYLTINVIKISMRLCYIESSNYSLRTSIKSSPHL